MILIPTTTVSLLQPGAAGTSDDTDDWGGAPDPETGYSPAETGIRAHLSAPSGSQVAAPEGSSVEIQFRLIADPCGIADNMQVRDDTTGEVYAVAWSLRRGQPIPHVVAGLTKVTSTA